MTLALSRLAPIATLGLVAACGNPIADARIDQLGDELPGVEPSEFHRPGQPCTLCHSAYKGADPQMSIGGTIFAVPRTLNTAKLPVAGAVVRLTDASGTVFTSRATNCVGNFWITTDEWDPLFPLAAEVIYKDPTTNEDRQATMSTRISREGSCATCHTLDGPTQSSVGRVWCSNADPPPPFPGVGDRCPGKTWLEQ